MRDAGPVRGLLVLALACAVVDCSSDADAITAPGFTPHLSTIPVEPAPVVWSASCGTITQAGLWTAPSTPGSCTISAQQAGSVIAPATFTVAAPPPGITGVPFGATQVWNDLGTPASEGVNLAQDPVTPSVIITRLQTAKTYNLKVVLNLPGGGHALFMSVIDGVNQFDHAKWSAALQRYDTPAIKQAVATAVSEGTLIAANYLDEPHAKGLGDGNTWGPAGTFTKARVDSLCAEGRALFPTLPAFVTHEHQIFEPTKSYRDCQGLIDQYRYTSGIPLLTFRADALTMANRDGLGLIFGANVLGGGYRDTDGVWDCKDQGGYLGTSTGLCAMPPVQLDSTTRILGPWGCGFRMWRWDDVRLRDYQPTMRDVSAYLASVPGRPCSVR